MQTQLKQLLAQQQELHARLQAAERAAQDAQQRAVAAEAAAATAAAVGHAGAVTGRYGGTCCKTPSRYKNLGEGKSLLRQERRMGCVVLWLHSIYGRRKPGCPSGDVLGRNTNRRHPRLTPKRRTQKTPGPLAAVVLSFEFA
eukprot:4640933-Amphidinium_carterae.1